MKEPKNLDNWTNMLDFRSKILRKPERGGVKKNTAYKIKKRIANCENDVADEEKSLDTHQKPRNVNSE